MRLVVCISMRLHAKRLLFLCSNSSSKHAPGQSNQQQPAVSPSHVVKTMTMSIRMYWNDSDSFLCWTGSCLLQLREIMHTFVQRAVNRDGTSENAAGLGKVCNGGRS